VEEMVVEVEVVVEEEVVEEVVVAEDVMVEEVEVAVAEEPWRWTPHSVIILVHVVDLSGVSRACRRMSRWVADGSPLIPGLSQGVADGSRIGRVAGCLRPVMRCRRWVADGSRGRRRAVASRLSRLGRS